MLQTLETKTTWCIINYFLLRQLIYSFECKFFKLKIFFVSRTSIRFYNYRSLIPKLVACFTQRRIAIHSVKAENLPTPKSKEVTQMQSWYATDLELFSDYINFKRRHSVIRRAIQDFEYFIIFTLEDANKHSIS